MTNLLTGVLAIFFFGIAMIVVPVAIAINIVTYFLVHRESHLMEDVASGPSNPTHRRLWFKLSFLTDTETLTEEGLKYRRWYIGTYIAIILSVLVAFVFAHLAGITHA